MTRLRTALPTAVLGAAALAAGGALAVAAGSTPAAAGAAASSSSSEAVALLTLNGPAGRAIRRAGVRVRATVPAFGTPTVLRLPVRRAGVTTTTAALRLGGTIAFRGAHRRTVTAKDVRVRLTRGRATLTAVLAGHRTTIAAAAPPARRLAIDAPGGRAGLRATSVRLSAKAAATIRRRLRLRHRPTGALGTLTVLAGPAQPPTTTPTPATTPTTTTPTDPGTPTTTTPGETSTLPRPATAVDVASATITWHVRDSFVQYIASGEGTTAEDGATADPASGGCTAAGAPVTTPRLAYQYHFPFRSGWYDPATREASLIYGGTVRFRYRAHTIDLAVQNPEIQLNGAASQAIFRYGSNAGDTGDRRGDVFDLTLGAVAPAACAEDPGPQGIDDRAGTAVGAARRYVYERVPGVVPAAATTSVFNGFYAAGDPFGWVTVSFTTAP